MPGVNRRQVQRSGGSHHSILARRQAVQGDVAAGGGQADVSRAGHKIVAADAAAGRDHDLTACGVAQTADVAPDLGINASARPDRAVVAQVAGRRRKDIESGIDRVQAQARPGRTLQVNRIAERGGGIDTARADLDDQRIACLADRAALRIERELGGLDSANGAITDLGVIDDRTGVINRTRGRQRGAARGVDVCGPHVADLVNPHALTGACHQRACGVARGVVAQGELNRLVGRTDAALCRFQYGFLGLNDGHANIGDAQDGVGHLDADLAGGGDLLQVSGAAVGIGFGGVGAQVDEAVGHDIQAVRQNVESVFFDHRQGPVGPVQVHVVAFGRHDGQPLVGRQVGRQAPGDAVRALEPNHDLAIVVADLTAGAQHHAVANHVGLLDAGLRVGTALGKHRAGQRAEQFGVCPLGQCADLGFSNGRIGGIDGRDDAVVVGLVDGAAELRVQCLHFCSTRGLDAHDLPFGEAAIQVLLPFFCAETEDVGGRVDGVGFIAGHVAAAIRHYAAHIAQAPVAAKLRAGGGERQLPAVLGRAALQRGLVPQRQQLGFGAFVAAFVSVVVDQVAGGGFKVHVAAADDLVDPQVAAGLLDGDAVAGIGRQAAVG